MQLVRDLERIWRSHDDKMRPADLLAALDALDDRQLSGSLTASELTLWLRRFGKMPEPNGFRLEGRRARGYFALRASFNDVFECDVPE